MLLSINKIKEITSGAVKIEEKDGYIKLHRFTEEQEQYYEQTDATCFFRVPATAGVKMRFNTDGSSLQIKFKTELASSRSFFSLDLFINGVYADSADNFSDKTLIDEYSKQNFDLGTFEKEFNLGDGEKEICLYFPWSVALDIKEINVVGANFVRAVRSKKTILFFGDSITQGYDALRSYKRYAAEVSDALNAEEINKGIGGEGFAPNLVNCCENFSPDYICVAYGTNDWSNTCFESFKSRLENFFRNLCRNYPTSKIFAVSPIWRIDYLKNKQDWDFFDAKKTLCSVTKAYENVSVIDGFDLVPHDRKCFSDDYNVHPNDLGFDRFSQNLIDEIKNKI